MIKLFDRRRARLMAGLLMVALVQLTATITVAHALHGSGQRFLGLAVVAAVTAFACEAMLRRLTEGLGLDYTSALRDTLFRHLMSVEPGIVARRRHGAMLQSFVGDLTALRQWVAEGIMRGVLALIALTGLLGWLVAANPQLGLRAAAIIVATCLAGATFLPALSHSVRTVRRERGSVAAFASERLSASATVYACGRIRPEANRLSRRVARLNQASLRRAWLTGLLRALPHLATTAIVICAAWPGADAPQGGLAGLVLAIGIIGVALRDLARAAELAVPGLISLRRIEGLLALPRMTRPTAQPWTRGEVRMLVLEDLRLHEEAAPLNGKAEAGDVILVMGDAALRRALFRTMAGLESPLGGVLRWNGADLAALPPSRRRRFVGLASPDLPLLAASDGFNLRYRLPEATAEDMAHLARSWSIDPEARTAPPARLMLARALLGRPPVLLLAPDDASLDETDATRLVAAIAHWPGVVLMASSRPQLCRTATRQWSLSSAGLHEAGLPKAALVPVAEETAA